MTSRMACLSAATSWSRSRSRSRSPELVGSLVSLMSAEPLSLLDSLDPEDDEDSLPMAVPL